MGWRDRAIGIVLGVVLGAGVVAAFVFVLSDETVDAPSLSGVSTTAPPKPAKRQGSNQAPLPAPSSPTAIVRVIAGAPPPSGPAELHYRKGETIGIRVISDSTLEVRVTGYGVRWTVGPDQSGTISFQASRTGTFALIVAGSHIDVARITVTSGN